MTMAAPHCTCDPSIFPSFGKPCPIHGSKANRQMADAQAAAVERLSAENARLRELYENVVQNREQFGWTINHLLECEDALRMAEEARDEARAEAERLRNGTAPHICAAHGLSADNCSSCCEFMPPADAVGEARAEVERLREALLPFAHPRCTSRDGRGTTPETDTMTVEVDAGDWMRACVVVGRMDAEYLRALPHHSRPSEAFIASLAPAATGKQSP